MEANQDDTDKKAAVWKQIKRIVQAAMWKQIKRILTTRQLCGSKSRGY